MQCVATIVLGFNFIVDKKAVTIKNIDLCDSFRNKSPYLSVLHCVFSLN